MTGGEAAQSADFLDAVYGNFPLVIALISALTFLLLARAFRSLVLPLKAVVLNLLSVGAAWGLMVLVWQHGFGSEAIWGIGATGSINVEMPIVVFAFLFGISMDYQVFIISRMREAYDRTGSTEEAVVEGIGRTGRLVTSAALILGLAFVAMSAGPGTEAKMFATALGGGILLDATLIRGVLAPAAVALLGRWNWWLPRRPARLLRVAPSGGPRRSPSPLSPPSAVVAPRPTGCGRARRSRWTSSDARSWRRRASRPSRRRRRSARTWTCSGWAASRIFVESTRLVPFGDNQITPILTNVSFDVMAIC